MLDAANPERCAESAHEVELQLACDDEGIPTYTQIRRWVRTSIAMSGRASTSRHDITVRLVSRAEITRLNALYRGQKKATNVLAFEAEHPPSLPADAAPDLLGDIVICAAVVAAEAEAQGKKLEAHWAHMLVHGTLHLLGFDHNDRQEAEEMESLEVRVLDALGLEDPYASCQ